ncbi:MAG: hypothetical protein LAQ30_09330 [Acidobacteriia bacterium]|nr:hypothetical protein [Terriglobia bacterium]
MHRALRGWTLLVFIAGLYGQDAQAPPPASPPGLETDWDIGVVLREIGAHAGRLLPALDRVDAQAWVAKGASDTYGVQLESAKQQAKAMEAGADELARNPEKLSQSLELFFRIQGLDTILASLEEGMRKYQGPTDAAALASLAAENGKNRERFRGYIETLAAEREKQFEVMDREAQRCRGMVAAQPSAAPARSSGRKK